MSSPDRGFQTVCQCPHPDNKGGRKLVVCIDGTLHQFGEKNTNVVEICSKLERSDNQLVYYNSGIGTTPKRSLVYRLTGSVDALFAHLSFEKIIFGAYRWLSDNYEDGDRLYFFGFSRGAYQIRTLAGMICKVGLLKKGNHEQIPFAFALYAKKDKKEFTWERQKGHGRPSAEKIANDFKETFSRHVPIHFVGVWDTVSSLGFFRQNHYPLTDSAEHICFFRQALALDEYRVKYLPEYVNSSTSVNANAPDGQLPHVKEVWFPGTHSDIGGSRRHKPGRDLGTPPFFWMLEQALSCGLIFKEFSQNFSPFIVFGIEEKIAMRNKLGFWWLLELMPLKRPKYSGRKSGESGLITTRCPHIGHARTFKEGQKIHITIGSVEYKNKTNVSFRKKSTKKADEKSEGIGFFLLEEGPVLGKHWIYLVQSAYKQLNSEDALLHDSYKDIIEKDFFDPSILDHILEIPSSSIDISYRACLAFYLMGALISDGTLIGRSAQPLRFNNLINIATILSNWLDDSRTTPYCLTKQAISGFLSIVRNTSYGKNDQIIAAHLVASTMASYNLAKKSLKSIWSNLIENLTSKSKNSLGQTTDNFQKQKPQNAVAILQVWIQSVVPGLSLNVESSITDDSNNDFSSIKDNMLARSSKISESKLVTITPVIIASLLSIAEYLDYDLNMQKEAADILQTYKLLPVHFKKTPEYTSEQTSKQATAILPDPGVLEEFLFSEPQSLEQLSSGRNKLSRTTLVLKFSTDSFAYLTIHDNIKN